MKKYYRRRIIASGMLAFVILLTLVIGGIYLATSLQTERNTDRTVRSLLTQEQNDKPRVMERGIPGFFGATPGQAMFPSAYYQIETDADGQVIACELRGYQEESKADIQATVDRILQSGRETGKLGAYKYGVLETESGGHRLILMDVSIQLQTLSSVLRSALLIGLVLSVLLLAILFPVSNKAADLIIRNTEKQKQFITDAGHELKTPVAVIRSNLDVMELLDGKSKWSGNIRDQVDRLEGLVKQLLLLAKLDEKQWTGKTEIIDMQQLLENELVIYQEPAEQKNLNLRSDVAKGLRVLGDTDSLRQMIHAVMDNAVQYTPSGGEIRVRCRREKKQVRIDITNTVDQLPKIEPDRLTDRFTRGDTARSRKNGGTGIGLSTAKSVAEMVRGSIKINYLDENTFQVVIDLPAAA